MTVVHVMQIKNREEKSNISNQVFKTFSMKKYLRQQNDDISAKVQFHGCFKSFNETLGNILKVHFFFLTYISISTYSTRGEITGEIMKRETSQAVTNRCRK